MNRRRARPEPEPRADAKTLREIGLLMVAVVLATAIMSFGVPRPTVSTDTLLRESSP